MSKKLHGALDDVDPKEAGSVIEKLIKVLQDLFK